MSGRLNVFETFGMLFSVLDRMYWYFIWFALFDFICSTRFLVYRFLLYMTVCYNLSSDLMLLFLLWFYVLVFY